jgi:hypothetical protein
VRQVAEVVGADHAARIVECLGHRVDEAFVLAELRLQQVAGLLGLEAERLQLLVAFPFVRLQVDGDDGGGRQHQRQADQ